MIRPRRAFLQTAAGLAGAMLAPAASVAANATRRPTRWIPTVADIRARSPELWYLTDLINHYRRAAGLHAIRLSPRLTAVAALHTLDLADRGPQHATGSLHSWSPGPRWTGGAYRLHDESTWPVMWYKPREIADYPGLGFEVSASGLANMRHALSAWRGSPPHNALILGQDVWRRMHWRSVGAVFYRGYACAWFGEEVDLP